jgi:hypothetical protein
MLKPRTITVAEEIDMHQNHTLRLARPQRLPMRALFVLLAALALPAAVTAQAPGVKSAPVAFKNSTNMDLEIVCETVVNDFGEYPLARVWYFKAGEFLYLTDNSEQKIPARKINYTVRTPGKSSRWNSISPGPDAQGYFVAEFTQQNLQTHLGQAAAPFAFGNPPVGGNGPTQQQLENGALKMVIAILAHLAAEDAARQPNAGFGALVFVSVALAARDEAIRSGLQDLFPALTPRQSADVRRLVIAAANGNLNLNNVDQQQAKQRLANDLRAIDPNLANVAVIADFIFAVHQMQQRNRR